MSRDIRKLFSRYSYIKDSLTTISEKSKVSTNSTGHLTGRSRSNSLSECSDATETTNLSFTWPLSRSQTDVSNTFYHPIPSQTPNEPEAKTNAEPPEEITLGLDNPVKTAPPAENTKSVSNEEEADVHNQEWINMLHSEEMLQRLKSMRIVTMTTRKWKIKKRPDGTRYLSYKRSTDLEYKNHAHAGNEHGSSQSEIPDLQPITASYNQSYFKSTAPQVFSSEQLRKRKSKPCQSRHTSPKLVSSCQTECVCSSDHPSGSTRTVSTVAGSNNPNPSAKPSSPHKPEQNSRFPPRCAQRRTLLSSHAIRSDYNRVLRASSHTDRRRRHSHFVQTCPLANGPSCRICCESKDIHSTEPCYHPVCISGGLPRRSTVGATKLVTMLVV